VATAMPRTPLSHHHHHAGHVCLIIFDFDQTLSSVHVFKSLAGWKDDRPKSSAASVPSAPSITARDERLAQSHRSSLSPSSALSPPNTHRRNDRSPLRISDLPLRSEIPICPPTPRLLLKKRKPFHVPTPYASTELGQIRRIEELDRNEFSRESFVVAAFGGEARVQEVREHLQLLHARGTQLVICSKGLIGPVRRCLTQLNMLHFFSHIYGNIGSNYGETPYDKETLQREPTPKEREFLGSPEMAGWRAKERVIARLMNKMGLVSEQVILCEDDPAEIRRASSHCRTLHVKEASGLTSEHWHLLLRITERDEGHRLHVKSKLATRPASSWQERGRKPSKNTVSTAEADRCPSAPPLIREEEKDRTPSKAVRNMTRRRSRSTSTIQAALNNALAAGAA